jgi:arylsulfatase A-like enzyme
MNHISKRTHLCDLSSPYVYVEHHKGGHSPYGKSFDEFPSSQAFFNHFSGDESRIKELYHGGIDQSVERFLSLYEEVRDRGNLEQTLLIFTSDHGELLGEPKYGGIWDHGSPVVPELVSVPTVFAGAGLPEGEAGDAILSGTDLAPTALASMGREVPPNLDGSNLWSKASREDPVLRSEYHFEGREVSLGGTSRNVGGYEAISLWNDDGGIIIHRNSKVHRALNCHYTNLYESAYSSVTRSKWTPRRHASMLRTYLPTEQTYGAPEFGDETVAQLREISFEDPGPSENGVNEITKEQLERLGYLE